MGRARSASRATRPAHAVPHDDPTRLKEIGTRFSSPVYPGETLRVEMWVDGQNVQFRTRVVQRDVVVPSHGSARIGV